MFSLISQNGHVSYGIKEYVCDSLVDLKTLPVNEKAGCYAYVIDTGDSYILNSKGEWKKRKIAGGDNSEEIAELEAQIEALTAEKAALTTANTELQNENTNLKNDVADLTANNTSLSNEVGTLSAEVADLKTENGKLQAQIEALIAENESLQEEIDRLTPDIEIVENTISLPEHVATIEEGTNTLTVSEEYSEVVGNKLILK